MVVKYTIVYNQHEFSKNNYNNLKKKLKIKKINK